MKLIIPYFILIFVLLTKGVDNKLLNVTLVEEGNACFLMLIEGFSNISYQLAEMNWATAKIDLSEAIYSGNCENAKDKNAMLILKFPGKVNITLSFINKDGMGILDNIEVKYNLTNKDVFPNAKNSGIYTLISSPNYNLSITSNYFACRSLKFKLNNTASFIEMDSIKLQPFNVKNSEFSSNKDECSEDFRSTTEVTTKKTTATKTTITTKTTHPSTTITTPTKTTHPSTTITTPTKTTHPNTTVTTPTKTTHPSTTITTPTKTTHPSTTITTPTKTTHPNTTITTPTKTTHPSTTITTPTKTTHVIPTSSGTNHSKTTRILTTPNTTPRTISTTKHTPSNKPKFHVQDKDGTVCLIIQAQLTLNVTYKASKKKDIVKSVSINSNSQVSGSCGVSQDVIHIMHNPMDLFERSLLQSTENTIENNNTITISMTFNKENNGYKLSLVQAKYFLGSTFFNDSLSNGWQIDNKTYTENTFYVDSGGSYYCGVKQTIDFKPNTLELNDFQFEAFRNTKDDTFGTKKTYCTTSPTVAIIVGVVLAVFLIIVIIIFIVFRVRANKRRGYQEI